MITKHKQTKQILDHLESGKTITSVQAQCIFSIHRLASRILELRKAGHDIKSTEIGGGFVRYELNQYDDGVPFEKEFFEFLKTERILDYYIEEIKRQYNGSFTLPIDPSRFFSEAFCVSTDPYFRSNILNKSWLRILADLKKGSNV